jgi:hypothetical protein
MILLGSSFKKKIGKKFSLFGPCGVMFISLSHGRKRNEPKRKATGCISEAKNRMIFPKTSKRASLERARFFTE